METVLAPALVAGVERITAWADLLDEINVFPVADGDTGRNLVLSLAPLRREAQEREDLIRELLLSARGNAGNIAVRFLSGLLLADSVAGLAGAVRLGRERAWQAVGDPKPGTMLTVFDALADALEAGPAVWDASGYDCLLTRLEEAVRSTADILPRLKAAGVVDAGALGAFLFLEGFFGTLAGKGAGSRPVTETFGGLLKLAATFRAESETGCCIDTVLRVAGDAGDPLERLSAVGESVVTLREGEVLKVHLHARSGEAARSELSALGEVLRWSEDELGPQVERFQRPRAGGACHVMTDAAGSLSRQTAAELGITLLDSYVTLGGRCLPESHLAPGELYAAMRRGVKVSTAQASLGERHQCYESVLARYPRVLYLCVGSVYTGNYAVATTWKRGHDPEDRFSVVDTGAASGRLGLPALAVGRFAFGNPDAGAVLRFARETLEGCREYVFLDRLRYLAAGGRLSRTGAVIGDSLRMKPVISPLADGARKVGVVRDKGGQLRFALERLGEAFTDGGRGLILLEYTDNAAWVNETLKQELARLYPGAEILVEPMSLTSGAHMGPETWGMAFLPARGKGEDQGERC